MTEVPRLFRPLTLRGLTLPNRIVVSPMCQYSAVDGVPQDWHTQHLGAFAASGPGLIVVEATGVEAIGRITPGCTGLYSNESERVFGDIVRMVKGIGLSSIGIQLAHAGRKASAAVPWLGGEALKAGAWGTVGPSAVPFSADWPAPRAADRSDLERIRHAFVQAAGRALRAGFDLIEAHCAHGYLLHEFLSPLSNRRTDEYGGSLENRMRFPLEVLRALRAAWPAERPLGMRISGSDWIEGGFNPDEAVRFAAAAKAEGVDFVCVSSGGAAPGSAPPGGPIAQVAIAEKIRAETDMVTRAVGGITEGLQAEAILTKGQADFVALARGFLNDPRWVWHAADALGEPKLAPVPPQYARAHPGHGPTPAKRAAA